MIQGMRLKFGPRQNDWRCCFCCHVRTGTIVLGIWHLLLYVLALSVIAVMLRYPELVLDDGQFMGDPVLPTPLSEVENRVLDISKTPLQIEELSDNQPSGFAASATLYKSVDGLNHRRSINFHSLNVGVVVTLCTFLITLLMVFGAVKGKPSYLMPFFCLQVFDFCIASLTAVGYLCYPPDIRHLVEHHPHLPFKHQLLQMNVQCLSLLAVFTFMFMMVLKAYLIGMVWSCYKYLSLRQAAQLRTIHYIDPDSQSLLHDLPDYETAVCDPRFLPPVKKCPPTPLHPPPPYASVAPSFPPPQTPPSVNPMTMPSNLGPSVVPAVPSAVSTQTPPLSSPSNIPVNETQSSSNC